MLIGIPLICALAAAAPAVPPALSSRNWTATMVASLSLGGTPPEIEAGRTIFYQGPWALSLACFAVFPLAYGFGTLRSRRDAVPAQVRGTTAQPKPMPPAVVVAGAVVPVVAGWLVSGRPLPGVALRRVTSRLADGREHAPVDHVAVHSGREPPVPADQPEADHDRPGLGRNPARDRPGTGPQPTSGASPGRNPAARVAARPLQGSEPVATPLSGFSDNPSRLAVPFHGDRSASLTCWRMVTTSSGTRPSQQTEVVAVTGAPSFTRIESYRVDLDAVINPTGGAIITVAGSGLIAHCNKTAATLYGYHAAELAGLDAQVLVPPELRAAESLLLRRVTAGEDPGSHRTQRLRRDGTVVPVVLTFSPIYDAADAVVEVAVIAHPAGEPPNVGDGVDGYEGVNRDGQPVDDAGHLSVDGQDLQFQAHIDTEYANERVEVSDAQDRFEAILSRERAQERVEVEQAQDRFQLRMSEERAQEKVLVHQSQDRFQTRMSEERAQERVEVEQAQDRFQHRMSEERAQDRADRERLQAQLHQGQRLEILGQLAGGVAHDFNNLLGVILNYAAFVAEELAAEPGERLQSAGRDVGQIRRAAERAAELTHQLLAFARREVVQPQPLDLNHVVRDVENLLRRTLGDDITLSTDPAAGLWLVLADAGQIEQILVNLAVNARDAMSDGGTLSIDTANMVIDNHELLSAGRYVRLRVGDTGIGMPAEIIEHAFEPFFTTKRDGGGTGLGLSTVYGIVAQTGGSVTIHSQPGTGTTFTILLPATVEAVAVVDEPLPYERTPAGETVLIVEDQEALREVTERIFARSGYHVITAANGAEAIAHAARYEGDIHLLLSDVVMPNMLGKEVAERIRRTRPDIEVLFMSGYAQPVLASQGRLDPGVNLIEKPFSAKAIIEKAGRILNGQFEGSRTVKPVDTSPPRDGTSE